MQIKNLTKNISAFLHLDKVKFLLIHCNCLNLKKKVTFISLNGIERGIISYIISLLVNYFSSIALRAIEIKFSIARMKF